MVNNVIFDFALAFSFYVKIELNSHRIDVAIDFPSAGYFKMPAANQMSCNGKEQFAEKRNRKFPF